MGVSNINGHRHKFDKDPNTRLCPFCTTQVEDEFHIMFICPIYAVIRHRYLYLEKIDQHNLLNMNAILARTSDNFAKYLHDVFQLRSKKLN